MVWQPTGTNTASDQEVRVGAYRSTMEKNALLSKAELGTVKRCQFNSPPPDHVFGYTPPKDPEGAREVTMIWKEHKATLPSSQVAPVADFKTLNKMAVDTGLTQAKDQPTFRKQNMVTLKAPEEKTKKLPTLPSNKNPAHTYGLPSTHRPQEVVRTHGPADPPFKHLVQGAYYEEWVRKNLHKEATTSRDRPYIPPAPTKAVLGHSLGASRYLQPPSNEELWKMSKFKTVPAKVTEYSGGSFKASAFQQYSQQTEQQQQYIGEGPGDQMATA